MENSVAWISLRENVLLFILNLENVTTTNSYLSAIKDDLPVFLLYLYDARISVLAHSFPIILSLPPEKIRKPYRVF